MTQRSFSELVLHHPRLHVDDTLDTAVRIVHDSDEPALPVVDERERYAGIFGEREFMEALFPGYLKQLRHARLRGPLARRGARATHQLSPRSSRALYDTEHVDVGPNFSDTRVAEIFLHHRVLVVPVVSDGRVQGMLTRRDFFRAITQRFVGQA